MTADELKALAYRYMEATRTRDVAAMEAILAPEFSDIMFGGPPRSRAERIVGMPTYPYINTERLGLDMVAEPDGVGGGKVAVWYHSRGTHEPTGKPVSYSGMFLLIVREGKITGGYGEMDRLGVQQQLGYALTLPQ